MIPRINVNTTFQKGANPFDEFDTQLLCRVAVIYLARIA